KSLCGSAGSISGDVLTWIDPSFSILEPLRESFLAVHFASRVFQQPVSTKAAPDNTTNKMASKSLTGFFIRSFFLVYN
ncbi:MAG TPA: hypothetical protein VLH56_01970, partial [Dissulfurispiraceae bacterium]|nr:hypothetical protein [Dissulfurispiraceae bacterium]